MDETKGLPVWKVLICLAAIVAFDGCVGLVVLSIKNIGWVVASLIVIAAVVVIACEIRSGQTRRPFEE